MREKLKIILSCGITISLISTFLLYSTVIMERKSSVNKYAPFFEQKANFDVLFMGTSHVINGVFPMELWKDYGIISYNFGGHASMLATTYWVMENALDYTNPELVVIDCAALSGQTKISTESFSYIHLSMDAFPFSITKVRAVMDLLDDKVAAEIYAKSKNKKPETAMGLIWDYSVYHNRWNDLKKSDFEIETTKEKGAESRIAIAVPDDVIKVDIEDKMNEDTISLKYLEKMIKDCQDRQIDVLLTYLPYPASEKAQKCANRVYDIAEQYGVNYINFLDLNVVDYKTDCYDADSHLNPSGAKKVTDYLGQYIMENYNILDQRENEIYSSWYEDYEDYKKYKVDKLKEQESLDTYLMLLADKNYLLFCEINIREIWENEYYVRLLENMGIDSTKVTEATNFFIIQEGGVDYFESFYQGEDIQESSLGNLYVSSDGISNNTVYLDDKELYSVTQQESLGNNLRIVVIDKDTMEVLDHVSFSIQGKVDTLDGQIFINEIYRK